MDAPALIASLERFPSVIEPLIRPLSLDALRWKPPDGAWSILEILAHLADEEVEDFRARLRSTLTDPAAPWPPIDPEGVARTRRYNELDPAPTLERFLRERRDSLAWLRTLPADTDWSRAHQHPKIGPISAGTLLSSWAAHDLLHLRQITKRLFQQVDAAGQPHLTLYAGQWTA